MSEPTSTDLPTMDAPVRVPNVSPGALSGLDHVVIGSAAQEAASAYDEVPDPGIEGMDRSGEPLDADQDGIFDSVEEQEPLSDDPSSDVDQEPTDTPDAPQDLTE